MVVISDLHLGKVQDTVTKGGIPSRLFDTRKRVLEAMAYAEKKKHTVVIAGDVYDSPNPNPKVVDVLFDIINYAEENSIPLIILPGNHDCAVDYSSLLYMANEIMNQKLEFTSLALTPEVVVIDGQKVMLLPHVPKSIVSVENYQEWVTEKISTADSRGLDMVIGHAHLTGAKNTSDIELEAGDAIHFNPSKFFKYKLGIFGHIHKYQELNGGKNVYCGPVCTNSFDEAPISKGFVVVNKDLSYEFVPYAYQETEYRRVTIDLVNKDAIVYDEKKLKQLAENKLLKITVYARDMMQVDQVDIKKHFEEYGTVMRFEIIISEKYSGSVDEEDVEDVFEAVDYKPVFKKWIEDKQELDSDQKKLVTKIGYGVIEEVLNASRT